MPQLAAGHSLDEWCGKFVTQQQGAKILLIEMEIVEKVAQDFVAGIVEQQSDLLLWGGTRLFPGDARYFSIWVFDPPTSQ